MQTTYHKDFTITFWDAYRMCWTRMNAENISPNLLDTMTEAERKRILEVRRAQRIVATASARH
jgi:hypothetical protein